MANQKALSDGVAPGGLYSKENIRIMLCYLLNSIDAEISKTSFIEILQGTEIANYFEITDSLAFLENTGVVHTAERDGDFWYTITDTGKKVAESLYTELPRTARTKAYVTGVQVVNRERMKSCTDVEIKRVGEDGCNITLTVYDENKTVMMQTTLYTADYMQADAIAERFRDDPTKLYAAIIDTLTV